MSVLQVYLNWANSVLSDYGELPCEGVSGIQDGRILCRLIDKLCSDAQLEYKVEGSSNKTAQGYLRVALDHMRNHGIKFHFTPQDILDGDIKSILDVLWLIILNYGIHSVNSSPYQRSVGIGKKVLLDWCQRELQVDFDPQNSLTYNLCTGDWLLKLLSKHAEVSINENIDREENLKRVLTAIEKSLGIKQDIINPNDVTEGTIDEHTLMIYVSLLRLKVGDDVDVPLKSPSDISFQSTKSPLADESAASSQEVPSIVLSEVKDRPPTPEVVTFADTTPKSISPGDSPDRSQSSKQSGTGSETSDWLSQSSNSPLSSVHDRNMDTKSDHVNADSLIKETISQHVEAVITPSEEMKHHSRIPVRVRHGSEEQRSTSSPGRIENDAQGPGITRKISVKVQRPRSPNSIMAEARIKQEQDRERRKKEREESQRAKKESETEEPVLTGSASETGEIPAMRARKTPDHEQDPVKSDEDDVEKVTPVQPRSPITASFGGMNGDVKEAMPVFIMPDGQKHDMSLLLEALRHARTEANIQDQKIQNGAAESSTTQEVVDKDIEQLEAQLMAVKEQSKELFEPKSKDETTVRQSRGRVPVREPHVSRRGERRSPPRGILDVMANQDVEPEQTIPKYSNELHSNQTGRNTPERRTPTSILRNRVEVRSPSDFSQRPRSADLFEEGVRRPRSADLFLEEGVRNWSHSPIRRASPLVSGRDSSEEEQDPDKRLIKFLTKEIENLKLKMAIMEKSRQRSPSPYGMGPRVTGGLPERERSPGQISSRARARFSDLESEGSVSSYSPTRYRSPSFPEERSVRIMSPHSPSRSMSPGRVGSRSPGRVSSRSPSRLDGSPIRSGTPDRSDSRSPVSMYRSRTPDRLSGERVSRPFTPRVLSLQDLSTSIMDDPDGKTVFAPASGATPVDLGYSSPIRKVTQEIWGYGQTEDEYYSDTAKYEQWKRLISRDSVTDEDMLELKQALASCLVELDIVSAKLKNANSDIKEKMAKTSEVLNDCRAHLTKSQAENAELRSQNEKEKARGDAVEVRLRDMEENLHSAKSNQDDLTQELEESVYTLKGIVGVDKTNLSKLGDENDKLRQKLSDVQRENIKLKEDFNELKMYNDKAQTTIKDLKSCLEDARSERKQLVGEIKTLQDQGKSNQISSIVNHYMEKGLYEEPEKVRARSRSPSPRRPIERAERSRSVSPVRSRATTPMSSSPVKLTASFQKSEFTPSRSQTPTNFQNTYNYEDISPAVMSDGHEIYPHRRTRSYVQKYGIQNEEKTTPIDLDDPELQELLNSRAKLTYDVDLNESYPQFTASKLYKTEPYNGGQIFSAKRPLKYSPYMDKDYVPKSQQLANIDNTDFPKKSPVRQQQETYISDSSLTETELGDIDDNKFIEALDTAVRETPVQRAQRQFLDQINRTAIEEDFDQKICQAKGILKLNKSSQNLSIKENIPRRSVESRSYSPSMRNQVSRSQSMNNAMSRSFSPGNTQSRLQSAGSPVGRPCTRSYSPGNPHSPSNRASRSVSPGGTRSYSPGDRLHGTRDSGYSTPTNGTASSRRQTDNRSFTQGRSPHPAAQRSVSAQRKLDMKACLKPLLSDDERRYADLLIDKYTRQHFIGVPSS